MKNPTKRLGSVADSLEVMNHKWFENFHWEALISKKMKPLYKPNSINWEENFDIKFLNMKNHKSN